MKFFLRSINLNSLKARLTLSALLTVIVILPIIGFTLSNAFEQQLINSIENELSAYNYSILSVAEVESQQLLMPEQLLENQFNVSQSGLYSLISQTSTLQFNNPQPNNQPSSETLSFTSNQKILWRSNSLLGLKTPTISTTPTMGERLFSTITLEEEKHFIFSFSASFTSNNKSFPITIHIIKNYDDFNILVKQFQQQLWLWLSILMIVLLTVQGFWLKWTLKPLSFLKKEITQVEKGERQELQHDYPLELALVTKQLNLLLKTERKQRQRYRNALSDLAHSLKTPLAVIQTQTDLSDESNEQLNIINKMIEHQLKRAQSAGESAWHIGINVQLVIQKLCNAMEKIYADKSLSFQVTITNQATFNGDESDLLEMLGNIIDNACKAAKSKVHINVITKNQQLTIKVADDGTGISPNKIDTILKRGIRADTYQQGHGIGLAIVRDLVKSYQGTLIISTSTELAGAEFSLIFNQ